MRKRPNQKKNLIIYSQALFKFIEQFNKKEKNLS